MPNFARIAIYSLQDQLRQKSFYILLAVCILMVLLLRGCYHGNAVIGNRPVDSHTVGFFASIFAFHLIAGGMMLLATLISMTIFTRDSQNGNMVLMLSKPIKRSDYLFGRIAGVWILISAFMFVLHLTIVIISFMNTGEIHPEFFLASFLCTMNLLFLILLTCLLALFLPDFLAAVTVIGITAISFFSDSFFFLSKQSEFVRSLLSSDVDNGVSFWRVFWPKTAMFQYYAASIIGENEIPTMGPIHPIFNILFFIIISYLLLLILFNRKEI